MSTTSHPQAFWNRAEFKIIVGYLVGSWTLLEFMNFSFERLNISPVWTEIFLKTVLMLIPTILVIAFIPKGKNRFLRIVKKIIPSLNVIIICLILIFSFWGRELGAMTAQVSYLDEDGNTVTSEVLKGEFLTRVGIIPFTPADDFNPEEEQDWLGDGIAEAVYFNFNDVPYINDQYRNENPTYQEKIKLMQERDFLIEGTYKIEGKNKVIDYKIYGKKMKLVKESSITSASIFEVADQIKTELLSIIKIPKIHQDHVPIPFEEFVTDDEKAWQYFANSEYYKALEEDETFAYAYLHLMNSIQGNGLGKLYHQEIARRSLEHVKKLPVEGQMITKAFYYLAFDQREKAKKSLENFYTLNPGNKTALYYYVFLLTTNEFHEEAADITYEDVTNKVANSSSGQFIRPLLQVTADADRMESLYNLVKYIPFIPTRDKKIWEGEIELTRSNLSKATEHFETAQLDDPNSYSLDSLIKVCSFLSTVSEDSLKSMSSEIKGYYLDERTDREFFIEELNHAVKAVQVGTFPRVLNYIAPYTLYYADPYPADQPQTQMRFVKGPSGEINKIAYTFSNTDISVEYYVYRVTPELSAAIESVRTGKLEAADSLFSLVLQQDSSYYFVNEYLDAISFAKSEQAQELKEKLATKSFYDEDGDSFTFELKDDQLFLLPDFGGIRHVYPMKDNWLFNGFGKHFKYRVVKNGTELAFEVYKFNHDTDQYEFEYRAKERISVPSNL